MFMNLRKATENDSERLKAFFEKMHLPGAIDMQIRRTGSFFEHYRLFSEDSETLILTDENDDIQGMASLLFREGYLDGEKQNWGFATDLRIAPTRQAVAQWAHRFLPVLEQATEERRCRYVFSAIEIDASPAYNALIRPTSHSRRRLPRYHLLNRFRIVCLHGRWPFADQPLTSIKIKALELSDIEALCAYLNERGRKRPLAGVHTPETFLAKIARWPGLSLSDFRIVMDSRGQIRGCAALWDGRHTQTLFPQTYHGFASTIYQSLWLASFSRTVRPLAAPESPMPAKLLTHLACDDAEYFHRLVDEAYSRLGKNELLTYMHFRGNWRTLPPVSYIATSLPYGFYVVLPPQIETPKWRVPGISHLEHLPPEFEIAWL